jgi:arabinose-5-phosphate isomerase
VPAGSRLVDAIVEVTRKRMGMTAIVGADGTLSGVFTDGDLRRLLEQGREVQGLRVDEVMTRAPRTIASQALAAEAVRVMEENRINQLLVVDEGRLVGAVGIHDLLVARVL